jgi:putative multicomponent Na+:H+ antiporter subunit B
MSEDIYILAIVALLPLCSIILTFQVNPYHALILRGILGAVAALVYAVLGGADVALTEALVGTMLAITLYAVAVRSSLVMRLGVLKGEWSESEVVKHEVNHDTESESLPLPSALPSCQQQLLQDFRAVLKQHYMRLEVLSFDNPQFLLQSLADREVHAICTHRSSAGFDHQVSLNSAMVKPSSPYHTILRIPRLYHLLQAELTSSLTSLAYLKQTSIADLSLPIPESAYVTPVGEESS